MTDEDKKLILEWCGFKDIGWGDGKSGWWLSPDHERFDWAEKKTYPPLDLNFFFKYAVPKLLKELGFKEIHSFMTSWLQDFLYDRKDPAEAFGQALLKLIKEGK